MSAVRKILLLIPLMTGMVIGGLVMPTAAAAATTVSDVAPPPPRIENVPHRDGYVWAAGHWQWNGKSWTWSTGSYLVEQRTNRAMDSGRLGALGAQWRTMLPVTLGALKQPDAAGQHRPVSLETGRRHESQRRLIEPRRSSRRYRM